MKKSLFFFALLFLAVFSSNRTYSIELDTVWVSDINGQVLFQHPVSKNILIASNGITELSSQDGKFVRSFPFIVSGTDFSPDGTKILSSFWEDTGFVIELYDYYKQEVIFKTDGITARFLGDSSFVFFGLDGGSQVNLRKCNIDNFVITKYNIYSNGSTTALAASPDGKYISYATYEEVFGEGTKAYLYLLDAENIKTYAKKLGEWDSQGQKIEDIRFSPDSKKCRILSYSSAIPITIFDVGNRKILQQYNQDEVSNHLFSIDFIDNEHILLRGGLSTKDATTQVQKISNKEVIYDGPIFINQFSYNQLNYNLYCHYEYNRQYSINKTFCFDLSNIISGISPISQIDIRYNNRELIINNNGELVNSISIITIEGREVYKQNFLPTNTATLFEIPLELSNGLYLVNILSGKDNFNYKLLIKE